jgi:ATP-binding cassette, subfamily B (MDR/TAP), member 1
MAASAKHISSRSPSRVELSDEIGTNMTSVEVPKSPAVRTRGSWKHLFAFTRWSHAWQLLAALLATAATAALKTVLAVFLGKIFDVIADFGSGHTNGDDALKQVSQWCMILVGIGAGNWLANTAFLALWIVFGELQAHSARHDIFLALLGKDMEWFDLQQQGVPSLLVRIQT